MIAEKSDSIFHLSQDANMSLQPDPSTLESIACYGCGDDDPIPFLQAEDDLTGKPGKFSFVQCAGCGLVYQSPRIDVGPYQRLLR